MLIAQLREKMNKANAKMRAMLDTNPNGLNDEQSKEYDDLEKEFDDTRAQLDKAIQRDAKSKERESFMGQNQRDPLVTDVRTEGQEKDKKEMYREAFWTMQSRKPLNPEMTRSLNEGVAAEGAYLVPETFATTIIAKLTEKSYMRPLATVSMSSSVENIPVEGDDGANGWIDEEGSYPESDPTIGQVSMGAYKTGRILKVTEELLQDSISSIEAYVALKFAKSTTKAEELAFVLGDGVKKPTGFLITAEVGKTAASASAITADEIIDLWGSLDEDYAANAVWKMNRNTLVAIMKLKDSNGDYLVNKGLNGAPSTLLGRPIVINKHMPDIATGAKPISFGDMSYYYIKDRKVMTVKRFDEKYADTGHIGFRVDKRVDGKLVLSEAVKTLQMA
ncbi:phage major capsid protein [Sulfurimonas sp. HSL-1716]|uniref:phage major capsid protein n=1 Tax=Hydrocurvibacter sulfurireducens TaxID=3131937 RepID=UPI0031F9A248